MIYFLILVLSIIGVACGFYLTKLSSKFENKFVDILVYLIGLAFMCVGNLMIFLPISLLFLKGI